MEKLEKIEKVISNCNFVEDVITTKEYLDNISLFNVKNKDFVNVFYEVSFEYGDYTFLTFVFNSLDLDGNVIPLEKIEEYAKIILVNDYEKIKRTIVNDDMYDLEYKIHFSINTIVLVNNFMFPFAGSYINNTINDEENGEDEDYIFDFVCYNSCKNEKEIAEKIKYLDKGSFFDMMDSSYKIISYLEMQLDKKLDKKIIISKTSLKRYKIGVIDFFNEIDKVFETYSSKNNELLELDKNIKELSKVIKNNIKIKSKKLDEQKLDFSEINNEITKLLNLLK
jgi:hypothetical protein